MSTAQLVVLVLVLAIAAYASGGGADFGAGIWDLIAGDHDKGARPRSLVDYAMAPVWEANNVWLVFILVVLWTGFPQVFEAVMSTAWIAVTLAALGLVLRGAAFAVRKPTLQMSRRRRQGKVFGVASIVTPFCFAATIGGVASGRIPPGNAAGDPVTCWLNPTSVLFGFAGVVLAMFISAAFLVSDARRFGAPDLEAYFTRRAVVAAGLLIVTMGVGLVVVHEDAPLIYDGVTQGWGLFFGVAAPAAALLTVLLLTRGTLRRTRLSAIGAVTCLVLAWAFAQRPYLLPKTVTVEDAAGDANTLRWLVIVTVVAVLVVGPALALLYRLDLMDRLAADHDEDLVEAPGPPIR